MICFISWVRIVRDNNNDDDDDGRDDDNKEFNEIASLNTPES